MCNQHKTALQPSHPSESRTGQPFGDLPCQRCVPLYPLRYGITDQPYDAKLLPTLSTAGYPALKGGKAYGLRVLRSGTYVYLFHFRDGRMWTQHYLVTPEAQFAPIWWTPQDFDAVAPGRLTRPHLAGAKPYLPAPETSVADTVYLMVSDTVLTHCTLWKIETNAEGLRDKLTAKVKPAGGGEQSHAFDARFLEGQVHELAPFVRRDQRNVFPWSESQPGANAPDFNRVYIALNVARVPRMDLVPLAVALPDDIGVMSELNALVGARLAERNAYATDAARKLRVSHLITQLGEQAARETELDVFNNDSVGSAIPAGVGGGAANASRDRAYRAGLAHQERRLSFARNDARLAFEKQHPQTLATLDRTVEVAGTDLWDVFKTRQPWVNAVVGLYDVDEVESYLDFRCMIGHIVPGLLHCAAGADYLATYVDGNAPRGLLKYAVMGHPDIAKYVGKAAGQRAVHRAADGGGDGPRCSVSGGVCLHTSRSWRSDCLDDRRVQQPLSFLLGFGRLPRVWPCGLLLPMVRFWCRKQRRRRTLQPSGTTGACGV